MKTNYGWLKLATMGKEFCISNIDVGMILAKGIYMILAEGIYSQRKRETIIHKTRVTLYS